MSNEDWQNRTELLIGGDARRILAHAHVLVVGAGGVGGAALEMLARAGIGEITVADGDRVDVTNRNRQIAALTSTVGMLKTDVFAARLPEINPEIKLHTLGRYFTAEDMPALLQSASFDCVLDAIDTVAPKTALLANCVRAGLRVVSSMGSGAKLNPEAIRCTDISKTAVCPLARAVRFNLRKLGIQHGILSVFSTEQAIAEAVVPSGECGPNKKSVTGTISFMPTLFGCHCAAAVIRLLTAVRSEDGKRITSPL